MGFFSYSYLAEARLTDERLMMAYQQGDDQSFEILYRRFAPRVFGYLKKRVGDSARCEELLQVVFLKLHQSRRQYDPALPFTPWLFTIVRNSMIDAARTGEIFNESLFEEFDHKHAATAEMKIESEPEQKLSPELMKELPAEGRKVLQLRYLDEMSFKEIGRRLKISEQNARQRVSRAVRSLKKTILNEKKTK